MSEYSMPQRINGVQMDLSALPDEVLTNVHQYQVYRVISATGDLAMLEVEMDLRGMEYKPKESNETGRLEIDVATVNDVQMTLDFNGGKNEQRTNIFNNRWHKAQ